VPHQYVPDILKITDLTDEAGNIEIGPIPQGTPISLLSNIDLSASKIDLARVLIKAKKQLAAAEGRPPEEQRQILRALVPDLLSVNKCPRLRRRSRSLLRHGSRRRRQGGADRVPEDALSG
jgi:hypothetical protein